MASSTSATTTFSLDVNQLIDQALLPSGGELTSAIEMQKARIALNLLLIQLQNKNIPLSKIDTIDQALTADTATYTLDDSVSDVLAVVIEKDDTELTINRYGVKEYHQISNKTTTGRPSVYKTDRLNSTVDITFWPIPDVSTYTAKLLVSLKIEDITAAYQRIDLPARYLPLLNKWLAYELAINRVGVAETVKDRLEREYKSTYTDVVEEDRERVDFIVLPYIPSGR